MDNELIVNEKERKKEKRKLYRDIVFIILFGLLIIWFTGSFLANRNNIDNNDNDIKTELISRSSRFIKKSNYNDDVINYSLDSYDNLTKRLQMGVNLYSTYFSIDDFYHYLFVNFNFYYDVSNNTITSAEIEVEYRNDFDDNSFLKYFTPSNNLLTALTNSTLANPDNNYIDIYCDSNINIEIYFDYNNSPYVESYFVYTEDEYGFAIPTFGTDFYGVYYRLGNLANELRVVRQLYNETYQYGYNVGNQEGYDNGYDNGYDEGYDVGYQEGNTSGYNNGYSAGQTVGYNNGYQVGIQDGYNDGYDVGYEEGLVSGEGYDLGYEQGEIVGFNNGYDSGYDSGYYTGYNKGFVDGQKDTINEKGFKTLFNAIMNAPYNIFKGILNFEFLGVNLFSLFSFIFTSMLILWIVKIFKK